MVDYSTDPMFVHDLSPVCLIDDIYSCVLYLGFQLHRQIHVIRRYLSISKGTIITFAWSIAKIIDRFTTVAGVPVRYCYQFLNTCCV